MRVSSGVKNILLIILSPIVFFLLMEATTRMLWQQEVEKKDEGVVMKGANREVVHNGVLYKTNSYGLRYREIEEITPQDRHVLALGDSFIWGHGLPEEALVTTKLENMLRSRVQGMRVINAGISGYNTKDEYKQLLRLTPIYQPEHVLVFFFTNDILVKRNRKKTKDTGRSWQYELKEFLRKNSRFFAFLYYQYKANYAAMFGVPEGLLGAEFVGLDASKPGWVDFKQSLIKIRDYCKERNMGLDFIIIPTLTALNDHYPYAEMHQKVKEFVMQSDIDLIDLFKVFAAYPPVDLWVSLENTHWNDMATTLAAEEIIKHF